MILDTATSPHYPVTHQFKVKPEEAGQRLDVFINNQLPDHSRSHLKKMITSGNVSLNGHTLLKQGAGVKVNDLISITFPVAIKAAHNPILEPLDVKIIHEHPDFFIIYKPAGLNVHAPSHDRSTEVTLVDWILANTNTPKTVGYEDRPGIVHRLDKDTSGLMIIARTSRAHHDFGNQFRKRTIKKTYRAIVYGNPPSKGSIEFAIGRHPGDRKKMACVKPNDPRIQHKTDDLPFIPGMGKIRHAHSNYKVIEYYKDAALVEVYPTTGRTHQIRVHFSALGHPLLGDYVYGKKSPRINRHALHAHALSFEFDNTRFDFCYDEPTDMKNVILELKSE